MHLLSLVKKENNLVSTFKFLHFVEISSFCPLEKVSFFKFDKFTEANQSFPALCVNCIIFIYRWGHMGRLNALPVVWPELVSWHGLELSQGNPYHSDWEHWE